MKFKNDILLIYSKSDDESGNDWEEQFQSHLKNFLTHITKSEVSVDLVASNKIKNEDDLSSSALIIPILTEGFMEDKACLFAMEEFLEQSKNDVKTTLEGYDRVFKVAREPYDRNFLPSKIGDNPDYNFFETDVITDQVLKYEALEKVSGESSHPYWFALNDLCYAMRDTLQQIKTFGFTGGAEALDKPKIVYLAETAEDLTAERDIIKRDLIRHGYTVLPDKPLELNEKIIEERIKRDIEKSVLSIHLVGNEYGKLLNDREISMVELQNKISEEHSTSVINQVSGEDDMRVFHRLIWISMDPAEVTSRQKSYIEGIRRQAEFMDDTDIMETPIEELKSSIRQELKYGNRRLIGKFKPTEGGNKDANNIYIIANKSREKESKEVSKVLDKHGYVTATSSYEGSVLQVLRQHQKQLKNCDAAIVLYADESSQWLDAKIKDLIKSPGLGRRKPMIAKAILATGSKEIDNRHMDQLNAMVISASDKLDEKTLSPFFEKFELMK